jgi:hypothetical protein
MACRWPADAAAAEAVAVAGVVAAAEAAAVAEAVVAAESGSAESGSEAAESALAARVVPVAPPAACPGVRAACAESHDEVLNRAPGMPAPDLSLYPEGGMARWTARIVAIALATCPGIASAGTNCDAMPKGPERTDCYLALSRSYQAQSDLAAAKARAQSDAAWYRAITGEDPPQPKLHRRR